MDTALILKRKKRDGEKLTEEQIGSLLHDSSIIEKIISETYRTNTFTGLRKLEFLLTELSEIPITIKLEKTQKMLTDLIDCTKTDSGFL
ncbi:hypothetical protein ACYSNW_03495 [Enterococcus sp. LJL99]